ncbi:MAG: hypothetical protein WCT42_00595 [Candidatus Paceibacterota bacterium]
MKGTKTPEFDALLDKILDELIPHIRVCLDCKKEFKIEEGDVSLLKMLRSPAPKLCPDCRHRRRLSFSNYSNIYKRKCDIPGHSDTMLSPVAPIIPWVIYDYDTYYSDLWDPFSYGRIVNETQSFFDQFLSLMKVVPLPGVRRGKNSINSDFCFYGESLKDGYYVFGGRRSENVLFSTSIYDSKNIIDSYFLRRVDSAYDNIGTSDCYKCQYAYFSSNCIECDFVYDCRNCQNCFGCVNLRNKNYYIFNEKFSPEEYTKIRNEINLGSRKVKDEYQNKFWELIKTNPIRAARIFNSQNVFGNDIKNSKNCRDVFQIEDSENVRHSAFVVFKVKDSMDVGFSGRAQGNYEAQNVSANSSSVKFSFAVKESTDCEFLINCQNCTNCFGCVGLKNTSYSIFNKKYEPEEYFEILDSIKTKMLQNGEYGEFFPMSFAPYAYNSSMAHVIYPMTEEEAKKRGLFWQPDTTVDTKNLKSIKVQELPDNILDVGYEICELAIIGEKSGKPFRLIKREIDYYKQNNITLPNDTPYQRMLDRFKILNNFKVFNETCDFCNKQIESAYKRSDGFKPYCEDCYKREIV